MYSKPLFIIVAESTEIFFTHRPIRVRNRLFWCYVGELFKWRITEWPARTSVSIILLTPNSESGQNQFFLVLLAVMIER